MKKNTLIPEILAGAIAGVIATAPMTSLMEHLDATEVEQPDSALPPRTITREALEEVSGRRPTEALLQPATKVAHYGYGGVTGSLYSLLVGDVSHASVINGAAFGFGIWAGSYFGLLPAVGSSARATNRSLRVNAIMIAAHLLWGASVALLTEAQLRLVNSPACEPEEQ